MFQWFQVNYTNKTIPFVYLHKKDMFTKFLLKFIFQVLDGKKNVFNINYRMSKNPQMMGR